MDIGSNFEAPERPGSKQNKQESSGNEFLSLPDDWYRQPARTAPAVPAERLPASPRLAPAEQIQPAQPIPPYRYQPADRPIPPVPSYQDRRAPGEQAQPEGEPRGQYRTGPADRYPGLPASRIEQPHIHDYRVPVNPRLDQSAAPRDQAEGVPVNGVLVLRYGDRDFDRKLAQHNYDTLKITGFPPANVHLSPWLDDKGYFFWYQGGQDNRAHHYFPPNLKKIEINGQEQIVDEMRIKASQGFMSKQNGIDGGFADWNSAGVRLNGQELVSPKDYALRMSGVAQGALDLQKKALTEGAANAPDNPYFRIYLADVLMAEAMQPVIQNVQSGQKIDFNNPATLGKIDEAIVQLNEAKQVAMRFGNVYAPNQQKMPGLNPFGLNPLVGYNPDMFWGGALYAAWQREVQLQLLRQLIASGMLRFELPPALPPG